MDKEYYDTLSELQNMGVHNDYFIGWAGGYLENPEREEQRVNEAMKRDMQMVRHTIQIRLKNSLTSTRNFAFKKALHSSAFFVSAIKISTQMDAELAASCYHNLCARIRLTNVQVDPPDKINHG